MSKSPGPYQIAHRLGWGRLGNQTKTKITIEKNKSVSHNKVQNNPGSKEKGYSFAIYLLEKNRPQSLLLSGQSQL